MLIRSGIKFEMKSLKDYFTLLLFYFSDILLLADMFVNLRNNRLKN